MRGEGEGIYLDVGSSIAEGNFSVRGKIRVRKYSKGARASVSGRTLVVTKTNGRVAGSIVFFFVLFFAGVRGW